MNATRAIKAAGVLVVGLLGCKPGHSGGTGSSGGSSGDPGSSGTATSSAGSSEGASGSSYAGETSGEATSSAGSTGTSTDSSNARATSGAATSSAGSSGVSTGSSSAETTSVGATSGTASSWATGAPDREWADWTPPPDHPTTYTTDGITVFDAITGLTWQAQLPALQYSWANANNYCASLSLGGFWDWRLPTLIELESILDYSVLSPAINSAYFPDTPSDTFWTASPYASIGGSYWHVYFGIGLTGSYPAHGTFCVRCVR